LYLFLLDRPDLTGIYNVGFENLRIIDIANTISKLTNAKIIVKESNDPRSYSVNSDKILNAGFIPKKSVLNAIEEIINSYHSGVLKDEDKCYTLKWMQIMQNSGNI